MRSSAVFRQMTATVDFSKQKIDGAFKNIMKSADKEWGGFGKAPKFPQTFTINFLLRYAHLTSNEEAKTQALLSLDKQSILQIMKLPFFTIPLNFKQTFTAGKKYMMEQFHRVTQ